MKNQPNPPIELKYLVELAEAQAKTVLVGMQQPLMPSWVIVDRDNSLLITGTPWESQVQKGFAINQIKEQMRKCQAKAYSFLCEAWMATTTEEEHQQDIRDNKFVPVRERPERREIVMVYATDGKEQICRRWDIIREPLGAVERLKPYHEKDFSSGMESWILRELNAELNAELKGAK